MNWRTFCVAALMIALYACAQMPTSTPAPQPTIVLSPMPVTPTASIVPTVKVKNNNLLFVEFFGIT
ncbi:MAG TPA: hypothetical protein PKE62_02275 [Anaerolineales bacterium]|nr:hypothetical protein [Anaerolineales bacterium]